MDVFHTGNYVRSHYNFLIRGLSPDKPQFSVIASTLYNIHFRGSPSSPSRYLKSNLEKLSVNWSNKASTHINYATSPVWTHTILGSGNGVNPALYFFEEQLPELLGCYRYLHSLFRPETLITDIVELPTSEKFAEERVDFFLPLANLVIEIDGSQHQSAVAQKKDLSRNEFLKSHGVTSFRITTFDLIDSSKIDAFGASIREYISKVDIVSNYQLLLKSNSNKENLIYSTIYRAQSIIIEMIGRRMLNLSDNCWRLYFKSEISLDYIKLAIDDLFNWILLINKSEKLPTIELNSDKPDYKIDISVSERWDEKTCEVNEIYCRTDHFDYFPDAKLANTTGKDYFQVANHSEGPSLKYLNLNLKRLLYEIFGYEDFNSGQIDIIENTLQENDTIGLLPTGGGKSLCYQLPGLLTSGLILVVCPIKSLMRDQVNELHQIGFHRCANIDSDTSVAEKLEILSRVGSGKTRFLFISPERLQISEFRETIHSLNIKKLVSLIVIDEVHCMSEWGHDFRTSYLTLPSVLGKICTGVRKLCLTATASKKVLDDIQNEFEINNDNVKTLVKYERENLNFEVVECNPHEETQSLVRNLSRSGKINTDKAGIIFTSTVNGRSGAYPLYQNIKNNHPSVAFFTGSKPKNHTSDDFEIEKAKVQTHFKLNKFSLLVATKAFGMGVNKRNVYTTIHCGLPQSIESLYQEAGRAGRDNKPANCYVLYKGPSKEAADRFFNFKNFKDFSELKLTNEGDLGSHQFFLKNSINDNYSTPDTIRKILNKLLSKEGSCEISAYECNATPAVTQLALYRLKQIGIIIDWTIEDFRKGIYLVDFAIKKVGYYESIVRKLTHSDKNQNGIGLDTEQLDITPDNPKWLTLLLKLSEIVINYHLDTRVRSRIESLKTLMLACDNYDKSSPNLFRKNLESYFTLDVTSESLSEVVESKSSSNSIIKYLSSGNSNILELSEPELKSKLFPLRRYIESYPETIGLEIIFELLTLQINKDTSADSLLQKLDFYYKVRAKTVNFSKFIHQLANLTPDETWQKVEAKILSNIESSYVLDAYAKGLDNDKLTTKLIKKLNTGIKDKVEELNELI